MQCVEYIFYCTQNAKIKLYEEYKIISTSSLNRHLKNFLFIQKSLIDYQQHTNLKSDLKNFFICFNFRQSAPDVNAENFILKDEVEFSVSSRQKMEDK